jgi:hypothetical protein
LAQKLSAQLVSAATYLLRQALIGPKSLNASSFFPPLYIDYILQTKTIKKAVEHKKQYAPNGQRPTPSS